MDKKVVSKPVPKTSQWYLEPIGEFTSKALSTMVPEYRFYQGVVCWDKKPRNLVAVDWACVNGFEESRKTENNLRFSVWYKDGQSGEIELWKGDNAYVHPNSSRKLRRFFKTGGGRPVRIPRKRKLLPYAVRQ